MVVREGGKKKENDRVRSFPSPAFYGSWHTLQWEAHQENNIRTQLLPPSARPQRTRCSVFSLACSACSSGVCRHRKPNILQSRSCALFRQIPPTFRSGPFFARKRRKPTNRPCSLIPFCPHPTNQPIIIAKSRAPVTATPETLIVGPIPTINKSLLKKRTHLPPNALDKTKNKKQ